MERKTISIESYIEAGGILGTEIEVNEKAESSVLKRTMLRRNVRITRGDDREKFNAVGSNELAVVRAKPSFLGEKEFPKANMVRGGEYWTIQINDQQVSDKVEQWMKKENRIGHDSYRERFVEDFSREVCAKIKVASRTEKRDAALASVLSTYGNVLFAFAAAWVARSAINGDLNTNFDRGWERYAKGASYALTGIVAGATLEALAERFMPDDPKLKGWEKVIPNLQIPSLVAGTVFVSLNSSRLIRLKDSKDS